MVFFLVGRGCFPCGSAGKESTCNVGDLGSVPGLGRSHGEGKGYPLQYSGLENSMDRGAWWATVHRVEKSQMGLNDFDFHFWGFPGSSAGKESTCNAEEPSAISGLGRSPGEGIGYICHNSWAFLVPQTLKNPPAFQETCI